MRNSLVVLGHYPAALPAQPPKLPVACDALDEVAVTFVAGEPQD